MDVMPIWNKNNQQSGSAFYGKDILSDKSYNGKISLLVQLDKLL